IGYRARAIPTVATPSMSAISVAAIMRCELPAIAARTLWELKSGVISTLLTMNGAVATRNSAPTSTAVFLFVFISGIASTEVCEVGGAWPLVVGLVAIMM